MWRNLDLSRGSGVGAVCDRLLLQSAAAASLSGGPQSLDLSGWRRLPVSTAALVRVAREHASTLRALRLVTSGPAGEPLDGAVVAALIEAAPGLVVLHARVWVVSLFGVGAFSLAALRLLGPLPGALSIDELAVYSRDDVDAASVGEDEEREEGLRRLRLMPAGGGSAGGATTAAAAAADADDVAGLEGVGEEERPGDAPATLSELVAALQARPALRRLFEVQPAAAAPQGEGGRAAAWWAELWRPPAVSPSHPRLAGRLLCG